MRFSCHRLFARSAVALIVAMLAPQLAANGQRMDTFGRCVPRATKTKGQVGCFIITTEPQGTFGTAPVFWHVTRFGSRAAADSIRTQHATVIDAFGRFWLMTIGDSAWQPRAGNHVAVIGPLPVRGGVSYSALYMEASMRPGEKSAIHRHSGTEAWYTLSGETCLETPNGTRIGRAKGPPVIVPEGSPMELTATGTSLRRSLVLILHDSTRPPTTVISDWKPRNLCAR